MDIKKTLYRIADRLKQPVEPLPKDERLKRQKDYKERIEARRRSAK